MGASIMNDWEYHKKEFIGLGGIIDNLVCRSGSIGRGLFREGKIQRPKIFCPSHLLINVSDATLVDGKFRLREDSKHSPQSRVFIENYYQNFSWEDSGRKEACKFLEEITKIPEKAKNFILNNNLCSDRLFSCELGLPLFFQKFVESRSVCFQKKLVLAPVWELINHRQSAKPFQVSQAGIETPACQPSNSKREIFFSYSQRVSPVRMFFNYGFSSDEVFAYSLPVEIKLSDSDLIIRIEGEHAGIESCDKRISLKKNILKIPALPVGSISKKLPAAYFYSIVQKYGLAEQKASRLMNDLQMANSEQRKHLVNHLRTDDMSDTGLSLVDAINKEIVLIGNSSQEA